MSSQSPEPQNEDEWVFEGDEDNPTYGSRAPAHLSSRQLTAGQVRALQPMVDGIIGLEGTERTAYIYKVCVHHCDFPILWLTEEPGLSVRVGRRRHLVGSADHLAKQKGQSSFPPFTSGTSSLRTGRQGPAVVYVAPRDLRGPVAGRGVLRPRQAVRNFFQERTRVRNVVVTLPGNGKRKKEWDAIAVCGEVYRDAIHDIAKEVSGLTAQDQRGWLPEYMKARRAYYYLLGDEQREELETLATKWNRGSIPMHLKKKYAVLSFRVRLFLHCTGSTSVPVNRS